MGYYVNFLEGIHYMVQTWWLDNWENQPLGKILTSVFEAPSEVKSDVKSDVESVESVESEASEICDKPCWKGRSGHINSIMF